MPFKSNIRRYYEDWMLHGEKELTTGGNPRPPPIDQYLTWIADAWESIPKECIQKSFKVYFKKNYTNVINYQTCAITISSDGSEDHFINCFKPDGPVPGGLAVLKKAREENSIENLIDKVNEIDFLQDEENGILSDNSIEF
jgi:hypothetical protein